MISALSQDARSSSWNNERLVKQLPLVMGVLTLAAAGTLTLRSSETYDDPWILYRYAANVASGHGWTFNPGVTESNAVTSPLLVLLLAGLLKLGLTLPAASALTFGMGTWGSAYFAFLALRSLHRKTAGVIAAVLILTSSYLTSLRGMESAILLGATSVALWALTTDRRTTTGVALGVAVLARPDSACLAVCVLIFLAMRHRSIPLKTGLGLACVVLPWLVYALAVFHSPLPSTLAAKQAQRQSGEWRGLVGAFLQTVVSTGHFADVALVSLLALGGCAVMVSKNIWALVPLIAASIGTFVAYEYVLKVAGYAWYAATGVYVSLLLASLCLDQIARQSPWLRVCALATASAIAISGILHPFRMSDERQEYADVAQWLNSNAQPGATVAAAEIGRLGYMSNMRMVDYLGLLDPRAVPQMKRHNWDWWVRADEPDYWVTFGDHTWDVETRPLGSAVFEENYELAYRTARLEVYARSSRGGFSRSSVNP